MLHIPENLIASAKTGRLLPFIGSGVSKLAGAPNWQEFADSAFIQLVEKGLLNFSDLEQINNRAMSPRVKLSLAIDLAKNSNIEIDFQKILHPESDWEKNENGRRIYKALWDLSDNFVTTNYDLWLHSDVKELSASADVSSADSEPPNTRFIDDRKEFWLAELSVPNRKTVIHLHGSIREPKNMVISTADYLGAYGDLISKGDASGNSHHFLKELFRNKDILFIGYQLDELEILEYLILKEHQLGVEVDQKPRHFILQPFFKSEEKLIEGLTRYFLRMGITLIPYFRDKRNYDQLIDHIEELSKLVKIDPPVRFEMERLMEDLLNEE